MQYENVHFAKLNCACTKMRKAEVKKRGECTHACKGAKMHTANVQNK